MKNNHDVISIIIPTRNRIHYLIECLKGIYENVSCANNIDVNLGIDTDDMYIEKYIKACEIYPVNILIKNRGNNLVSDYINYLALRTTGNYVWLLCDDAQILTPNFDTIILNKLRECKEQYIYVHTGDELHQTNEAYKTTGSCFPIISRNYIHATKTFFPSEIGWAGSDTATFQIFATLGDNHIIDLSKEIKIFHALEGLDDVHKNHGLWSREKTQLSTEEIQNYIKKLKNT